MTKAELIDQLKDMDDSQEIRVSLSGDNFTLCIVQVSQSKLINGNDYIRLVAE